MRSSNNLHKSNNSYLPQYFDLFIFWLVEISPASHEDIVPSVGFRKEVCQLVDALRDSIDVTGILKYADVDVE